MHGLHEREIHLASPPAHPLEFPVLSSIDSMALQRKAPFLSASSGDHDQVTRKGRVVIKPILRFASHFLAGCIMGPG